MKENQNKTNSTYLDKKIDLDRIERNKYFEPCDGRIQFIADKRTELTTPLYFGIGRRPTNELGQACKDGNYAKEPSYFYLTEKEYKGLTDLYDQFDIPSEIKNPLTVSYVSLVLANLSATERDRDFRSISKNQLELQETVALLEELCLNNNRNDTTVTKVSSIEFNILRGQESSSTRFESSISLELFQNMINYYLNSENFTHLQSKIGFHKTFVLNQLFNGHKNSDKNVESHFLYHVYQYLNQLITKGDLEVRDKTGSNSLALKSKNSNSTLFHFIGRMMMLAGSLSVGANPVRANIIDTVEKKLDALLEKMKGQQVGKND